MKQNYISAFFGRIDLRCLEHLVYHLVRGVRRAVVIGEFPVVRVKMKTNRNVTQALSQRGRLNLVGASRLRIAKIGRPEKPGRSAGDRLNESLGCIQFEIDYLVRHLAQIWMCIRMIADLMAFSHDPAQKVRVRLSVLSDYKKSSLHVFGFEYVEDLRCPSRVGPVVKC